MRKCSICKRKFNSRIGLTSHIYWKHYKDFTIKLTILTFILGLLIGGFLIPLYSEDIKYFWDKYVYKEEPDLIITLQSTYLLETDKSIKIDTQEEKIAFLSEFIKKGIIPYWAENKPFLINLVGEEKNFCLFLALGTPNKILSAREAKKDWPEINESIIVSYGEVAFKTPTENLLNNLSDCGNCLSYEIYGSNKGDRSIDLLNFEICLPENLEIIDVSRDLIEDGNCIRVKKQNIIGEEDFIGSILLKRTNGEDYFDLWINPITSIKGKYSSKEKEFDITKEDVGRIVNGIIQDCEVSL